MAPQITQGDIRTLDPTELRKVLKSYGITRIDTAARYQDGESEKILGRAKYGEDFLLDTKIALRGFSAKGGHTPEAIDQSLTNSLKHLNVEKINTLYVHAPDTETPLRVQAKAFNDQFHKGRFTYFGVCNLSVVMLKEWLEIAEAEGYIKPTYFQGQYNLLCRAYEDELFPLLKQHSIHFCGYSPLAGGFLLGNFMPEAIKEGSRFNIPQIPFVKWYNHESMFDAVRTLNQIAKETGIPNDELSLRWTRYHSALRDEDAIISGASKISHVESALRKLNLGPLEGHVADRLSKLWDGVKADGASIIDIE